MDTLWPIPLFEKVRNFWSTWAEREQELVIVMATSWQMALFTMDLTGQRASAIVQSRLETYIYNGENPLSSGDKAHWLVAANVFDTRKRRPVSALFQTQTSARLGSAPFLRAPFKATHTLVGYPSREYTYVHREQCLQGYNPRYVWTWKDESERFFQWISRKQSLDIWHVCISMVLCCNGDWKRVLKKREMDRALWLIDFLFRDFFFVTTRNENRFLLRYLGYIYWYRRECLKLCEWYAF